MIPRSYKKLSPHCSLDLAGSEEVIIVPEPPISDLSKTGLFTVLAANTGHISTTVSSQHFEMFSFYFNQGTLPSCSGIFGYFGLSSNRFVCDKMFMRIITVPQSPGAQPLSRAHTIFNLRSFIHSRSPLSNANFRNLQNRRQTCLTSRGKYVLVWRISGLFQKVQVT